MNTSQITIRKVDPILKQKIVRSAKLKSQSINDWVLDAVRARAGMLDSDSSTPPSWQKFVGTVEAKGLNQKVLEDFEKVDEAMWAK